MRKKIKLLLMIAIMTALAACSSSSDDDDKEEDPSSQEPISKISMSFKDAAGTEPEYLLSQEDIMQGTISAQGAGEEQLGWNFFYTVGNSLFVSGYENYETKVYQVNDDGEIAQKSTFFFDWPLEMFGAVGDTILLASDEPRDGTHTTRKLFTIDAETGLITNKVDYSIFDDDTGTPGEGSVGWATALKVRGNELYIPFHKLDDQGYFATPDPDTAYIAVYDYPLASGAAPKKIISDDRTSNIGVNGSPSSLITAENGDLYSLSSGALSAGFSPASTKPSGILRIKSGESEFDTDYFFNVEEATVGGKLFWFDYAGENKAIARIITSEEGAAVWSAYSKDLITQKLVIIDLVNQTVTDIAGVPLHSKQYTSRVEVMDGKVYVSIETAEDAFIYEVDVATATATKGAAIEGKTIKGFYNLYD